MDDRLPSQPAGDDPRVDAGRRAPQEAFGAEETAVDAAIRQALGDAAVPEGLLARLAAIPDLQRRGSVEEAIAVTPSASSAKVELPAKPSRSGAARVSRRTVIGGSLALAAAACVAGVFLYRSATDFEDWNDEVLARRAIDWTTDLEQDVQNREAWRPVAPETVEGTLGAWMRRAPDATGRYRLTGTYDRRFSGSVYRFGSAERSDAMLFVVDASTLPGDLQSSPPASPAWTSEGFAVGMWRRGDHLYVLAVRGDADDYARLIRRQVVA